MCIEDDCPEDSSRRSFLSGATATLASFAPQRAEPFLHKYLGS